ncbi:hypothetical protein FQN54_004125 [Arachnomyces sp. PD_36]|nr:hypothetical protein FQN54_004125 [Arachnomyces sp. PD_36]
MEPEDIYFDDHPSLSASLEDFEENNHNNRNNDSTNNARYIPRPPFTIPSQHSGFRSDDSTNHDNDDVDIDIDLDANPDLDADLTSSTSPWSPPGAKHHHKHPGSAWYRHQPYRDADREHFKHLKPGPQLVATTSRSSPARSSRDPSPQYEDAVEGKAEPVVSGRHPLDADLTIPANIPLPPGTDSPLKGRSPSPDRDEGVGEQEGPALNNYIRFALRAEVQHREPFVALFSYIRQKLDSITKTRASTTLSVVIALISITTLRALFLPPVPPPVPDLVKLSGLARSFEPLIYYSENGVQQIGTLQETGVAVWDLGESVRSTNMTSAPIIVRELDELSESLKSLSLELTRFFANVDADIDSILIVMDWAKRELSALSSSHHASNNLLSIVFENIHSLLSRLGALDRIEDADTGAKVPTQFGSIVTTIFGKTSTQRTISTLTHTFTEFLNVLEDSINTELTHSTALFTLFESIDRQFLNLQRTVARESDAQERAEDEMLGSLWAKIVGANAALVRKYEKNKRLLGDVRERTVANKYLITNHRGQLLTLKVGLETLRRKLVSPIVAVGSSGGGGGSVLKGLAGEEGGRGGVGGGSGSGAGDGEGSMVDFVVQGQIRGLEGAYEYLREVRERQKAKLMEMVYGAGARRGSGNVLAGVTGDD